MPLAARGDSTPLGRHSRIPPLAGVQVRQGPPRRTTRLVAQRPREPDVAEHADVRESCQGGDPPSSIEREDHQPVRVACLRALVQHVTPECRLPVRASWDQLELVEAPAGRHG